MPQIFVFAAAAAVAYAGWKVFKREQARVAAHLDSTRDRQRPAIQPGPTLERDPATGVYRPRDRA